MVFKMPDNYTKDGKGYKPVRCKICGDNENLLYDIDDEGNTDYSSVICETCKRWREDGNDRQ